jgi:hypothetical protein
MRRRASWLFGRWRVCDGVRGEHVRTGDEHAGGPACERIREAGGLNVVEREPAARARRTDGEQSVVDLDVGATGHADRREVLLAIRGARDDAAMGLKDALQLVGVFVSDQDVDVGAVARARCGVAAERQGEVLERRDWDARATGETCELAEVRLEQNVVCGGVPGDSSQLVRGGLPKLARQRGKRNASGDACSGIEAAGESQGLLSVDVLGGWSIGRSEGAE